MIHSCKAPYDLSNAYRVNRVSRVVPLDPPTEDDDVETPAEEACRVGLAQDTSRGARSWKQVDNIYSDESRWVNLIEGIKGGKLQPSWERSPTRGWFKRKD